ncbi:hypothetical protein FERRO_08370 [Ferrovum sp. JA12]|nr:hypothetical protein FERRO_08370 [Ferrovum sp. JA12]HQU05882.1 hypothetical protein [Ferrovaceae bacterium]
MNIEKLVLFKLITEVQNEQFSIRDTTWLTFCVTQLLNTFRYPKVSGKYAF